MNKLGLIAGLCLATVLMAQSNSTKVQNAPLTPSDGIIHVNNAWITKGDVDKVIMMYRQQMMRSAQGQEIGEPPPEVKQNIAMQLIVNKLLVQEATKRHITASSVRIDSVYAGVKRQFPDSVTMQKQLTAMGESESSIRSQINNGILVDSLMKTVFANGGSVDLVTAQDSLKHSMIAKSFIDGLMNTAKIMYVDSTYKLSAQEPPANDAQQIAKGLDSTATQAPAATVADSASVAKPATKTKASKVKAKKTK